MIATKNNFCFSIGFLFFLSVNSFLVLSYTQESIIPEPRYGGTLVDSSYQDVQLLNPVLSSDSTSNRINDLLFESMITFDKDMDFIPQLAKSWTVSPDKLDYTFELRKDVYWHDGERFDANDVIFTFDRIVQNEFNLIHPIINGDYYHLGLDLDNIPYEKIDEFTVIFYTKPSCPSRLANFMFKIIPEHVYLNYLGVDGISHTDDDCRNEEGVYTFDYDPRNFDPIGTGCMMFYEWEREDHITLIRNSVVNNGTGYWNQHDAYLDRYMLRIVPVSNMIHCMLSDPLEGINMMDLSSSSQEDIDALRADPNIIVYSSPTFTTDHIAFQTDPSKGNLYNLTTRDFTANPNHFAGYEWMTAENPAIYGHLVRKALNYAIDKQGLIDYAYPQGSRNSGPIYLPIYEWYCYGIEHYDYDPANANDLLEQAGFGATADDPLRKELDFTISYNQGNLRREKTCEFAKDQWANFGITVTIESVEWISMLSSHYDNRNFDAMSAGWSGVGVDPDLTCIWSSRNIMPGGQPVAVSPDDEWIWSDNPRAGGLNYMSYWNPTVDVLMDDARNEEEYNFRKKYYFEIQDLIIDDSPYVWLISIVNMIAVDSDFYGFVHNSFVGFRPEPVGFRNIYYAPEKLSNTLAENINFSGFELFSTFITFVGITFFYKKFDNRTN